MSEPTFVWSLYYPAPDTGTWRIHAFDIDGRVGLEVEIFMQCDEERHSPKLNKCSVCKEHHALPKASDQRYAYKWYPYRPSLRAVVQWNRRNSEREIREFVSEEKQDWNTSLKLVRQPKDYAWNDDDVLTKDDLKTWNHLREKFWFGETDDSNKDD